MVVDTYKNSMMTGRAIVMINWYCRGSWGRVVFVLLASADRAHSPICDCVTTRNFIDKNLSWSHWLIMMHSFSVSFTISQWKCPKRRSLRNIWSGDRTNPTGNWLLQGLATRDLCRIVESHPMTRCDPSFVSNRGWFSFFRRDESNVLWEHAQAHNPRPVEMRRPMSYRTLWSNCVSCCCGVGGHFHYYFRFATCIP